MENNESRRLEMVEEHKQRGWKVTEKTENEIKLVKRSKGSLRMHLIIALLTVWWSLGIGNAAYLTYAYLNPATKTIVEAGPHDSIEENTETKDPQNQEEPEVGHNSEQLGGAQTVSGNSDDNDPVYGANERRELAYNMGKATASVPFSGYFVRPVIWWYRLNLKIIPTIFGFVDKKELGVRLKDDNQIITEYVMAGHHNEAPPSE